MGMITGSVGGGSLTAPREASLKGKVALVTGGK